MPKATRTYYCNCQKLCKGKNKELPRSTYYDHKPYRDTNARFSAKLQHIFNTNPVVVYKKSSKASKAKRTSDSGSSSRARVPSTAAPDSVARAERTQGPSDDSHREYSSVCVFHISILGKTDVYFPNSQPRSPSASDFSPEDVSPSGPSDNSLRNRDSIEPLAPDFPDIEDSHGGPDSPDSRQTGNDEGPAPLDSSDHPDAPSDDFEDLWMQETIHLSDLRTTLDFVHALRHITLDDPKLGMSDEALERLRNPPREDPSLSIDDDTRLAIEIFLNDPSEKAYEKSHRSILRRHPEDVLPSYYKTNRLIADLTGIMSVVHDMCINSCIAYTGPFSELEACPVCSEFRYELSGSRPSSGRGRRPRQEFHTIPIGPQIQALYRNPESASRAHYLGEERARVISEVNQKSYLDEYSDVLHGADIIQAFQDGRIGEHDIALLFSIDGAQLYAQKASACWIYIWVLLNLSPTIRYQKQHIFIGGIIPGPNNPKNIDTFLFPGLGHLAALQQETLAIWDSALQREVRSRIFLPLITADGPGMMHVTGFVGYHGKHGCRLYCGLSGRRERQGKHYFPALLKPNDYNIEGSSHPDVDIRILQEASQKRYENNLRILVVSPNESQYRVRRLETGISKPSIFSGIDPSSTLGLPKSAGSDIMHLGALNLSDLMISLWQGTIDCTRPDDKATWDWAVLQKEVWQQHGQAVADCLHYLPSSFDRPPRNIAEKLTSGYKAWEFMQYLYGLGPGLLLGVLPDKYYANFCKLVFGMRLMNQHKITLDSIGDAQAALVSFAQEFEMIYCQRLATRIHFV